MNLIPPPIIATRQSALHASQSKMASAVEILIGTLVGFVLAFAAQHVLFLVYNIPVSHSANAWIVSWMTLLSVLRSYILRRVCNWWHVRKVTK